ncbi:hypothetical protein J4E00_00420 [Siccationidurans soli]|uniref:XRE family transcriptional regulator n=2 Tax=Hymenobacter negativus TaxID=2795026 RepID=A0ABS3Q950_9BACT|nr:hypothetical protein [Hymenobacter negativus]
MIHLHKYSFVQMAAPVTSIVPIDQRFAQLIQQFGLTKNSFAISLGKTASVVQHLIDGRNKPGYDLLCKVFEIYPNVSRDWLLLGRGPMLVSGEPTPKPVSSVKPPAVEELLEPIDLSDVELPTSRRPSPGVAGSRLQPAEIAATLALASAANQTARAVAPAPEETPVPKEIPQITTAPVPPVGPASAASPTAEVASIPVAEPAATAPPAPPAPTVTPLQAPTVAPPTPPPASAVSIPMAGVNPEAYVAAAIHAQHLQHQLAMAELRNQHLLEQQQMLREMLAMARQAMV